MSSRSEPTALAESSALDAERLEAVDVGAEVQLRRRDAMADAVPRQERHARAAERAASRTAPTAAPNGVSMVHFVPVGELGHVVQAAAADDANLDGHRRLERPGTGISGIGSRTPVPAGQTGVRAIGPPGKHDMMRGRAALLVQPTAAAARRHAGRAVGRRGAQPRSSTRAARVAATACGSISRAGDAIQQRLELARRQDLLLDVGQAAAATADPSLVRRPEPPARAEPASRPSRARNGRSPRPAARCPMPAVASVRRIGGRQASAPNGLQRSSASIDAAGPVGALAVGLVDHVDVGDLHDPRLQRLHIVARAGHDDDDRDVRGADDLDLVLPDADGLDEHDVVAGRVEHERRRRRSRAPGRRGARAWPCCG